MKMLTINNKEKKSFIHLIFLFIFPTVILFSALIIITGLNYSSTIKITEANAVSSMVRAAETSETKITSILDTMRILIHNFNAQNNFENITNDDNNSLPQTLSYMNTSYEYLDNIYIMDLNNELIVSSDGFHNFEEFFTHEYIYQNYELTYWKDFRFYTTENYRTLSPTIVSHSGKLCAVVPIVYRKLEGLYQNNLIVFNIKLETLINYDYLRHLTKSSSAYIFNKYTYDIFDSNGNLVDKDMFPSSLYKKLLDTNQNSFSFKHNGNMMLVSTYSKNSSIIGYTYFTLIDTNDILRPLLPRFILSAILIIAFVSISIFVAIKNAYKLYAPLYELLQRGNGIESVCASGNILNDIMQYSSLTKRLNASYILPCAQERYLVNFLNSTEYYLDEQVRNSVSESLNFPYNIFAVVIVQLSPTALTFDKYNSTDYANIQNGFYTLVKTIFSNTFHCFVLPTEKSILYIVLNVQKLEELDQIDKILGDIYKSMQNEMDYVYLSTGRSSGYSGIEGLKLAHAQAKESFTMYASSTDRISLSTEEMSELDFTNSDEKELFLALSKSDKEKVDSILKKIFDKNTKLPTRMKKQLIEHILNIVLKVMHLKKFPIPNGKLDFQILNEYLGQPPEAAYEDMKALIDKFLQADKNKKTKTDYKEILDYMEENYTSVDFTLDVLASHFNINPSHLSSTLKKELGIGFLEYITELRIKKAQDLLINTNMDITEIVPLCGFGSVQTFYRTFRNSSGISPGKYREQHK